MRELGKISLVLLVGLLMGFLYARKLPQVVRFQKTLQQEELRDSYFKHCHTTSAVVRSNGDIEESFSCPRTKQKFFLIKHSVVVSLRK